MADTLPRICEHGCTAGCYADPCACKPTERRKGGRRRVDRVAALLKALERIIARGESCGPTPMARTSTIIDMQTIARRAIAAHKRGEQP